MSSPKYQFVDDDSEKGETSYFIPTKQSILSSSPFPGFSILGLIFFSVGIFVSGVFSTLFIIALKSHSYSYGQYETGFQEEKLGKSRYYAYSREAIPNHFTSAFQIYSA